MVFIDMLTKRVLQLAKKFEKANNDKMPFGRNFLDPSILKDRSKLLFMH